MKNSIKSNLRLIVSLPYRLISEITGVNLPNIGKNLKGLLPYFKDMWNYNSSQPSDGSFKIQLRHIHPYLADRYDESGVASGDYFHQDLWASRKIFVENPDQHWDVGSRIDGFIAHLLSFRSVNVIDIRVLESQIQGLEFHQGDVTSLNFPDNSIASLSCLHAMEHVGLGRYGDPINPMGYMEGMLQLQRVLAPGGKLYFSVPIGIERVEFNGQRVFNPKTIIDIFSELMLIEFAAIDESGIMINPAEWHDYCNGRRGCGLFYFKKLEDAEQARRF